MESDKWNSVLIEWVNCLKLGNNVQALTDLRSGEFFTSLKKLLNKSPTSHEDILSFVFKILTMYPNYKFYNQSEIHLSDLPEKDIKAMVSLLIHYTCIYDRRDVLTSPLCYSLTQPTQLIIRTYLQKMSTNVDENLLNAIIVECTEQTEFCNDNKQSPLFDVFKTPLSKKSRILEKDRLITSLKSDLEMERFEKNDLQDELKQQNEKNKSLEKQLAHKCTELSRLRTEIQKVETNQLPTNENQSQLEKRRLELEIESNEQYIRRLEVEQEEMLKENTEIKHKLSAIESDCRLWQERFLQLEKLSEEFQEKAQLKEQEVRALQEQCSELGCMLDEYREKPLNDSSIFEVSSPQWTNRSVVQNNTLSCENLACSVVEVQLKEVQDLNSELKLEVAKANDQLSAAGVKIDELSVLNGNLQGSLVNQEGEYNLLKEKFVNLETDLQSLQELSVNQKENIQILNEQKGNINKLLDETKSNLESLSMEKITILKQLNDEKSVVYDLSMEIEELEAKLDEAFDISQKLKKERDEINLKNESLKKVYTSCQKQLEQSQHSVVITETLLHACKQEVETLQVSERNLKEQLSKTTEKLTQTEQELNSLSNDFIELKNTSNIVVGNLRKEIEECKQVVDNLRTKNSNLNAKWREVSQEHSLALNKIDTLNEKLNKEQQLSQQLDSDLYNLKVSHKQLVDLHENLKTNFKTENELNNKLKSDLDNQNNQIKNLNKNLEEVNNNIKVETIERKQEKNELNSRLEDLQNEKNKLIADLKIEKELTNNLKLNLESKEKELEAVRANLQTVNDELNTEINKIKDENDLMKETVASLENEKTKLESDVEIQKEIFNKLKFDLKNAETKLDDLNDHLNKFSHKSQEDFNKITLLVEGLEKEKNCLENNLEIVNFQLKTSYIEQEVLSSDKDKLNADIDELLNKLNNKELAIANLEVLHQNQSKKIEQLNVELIDAKVELTRQVEEISAILNAKEEKFCLEINEMQAFLTEKETEINHQLKEKCELLTNINHLETKIESVTTDLASTITTLEEVTHQTEDLKTYQHQLEDEIKLLKGVSEKYELEVVETDKLNKKLTETCKLVEQLEKEKTCCTQQVKIYEDKYEQVSKDNEVYIAKLGAFEAQVENYETELIAANAKIVEINCSSESARCEQETAIAKLMEKLGEKERLNADLDLLTLSLNQKIKEQEELKNNLQLQVQSLEAQVENYEKELISANAKIEKINCSSESAKSEQESTLARLMEKLDEKERLNTDLDSLTLSLNQKIKEQEELKNNLQSQVQSLEAQVENSEKELIAANAKIDELNCSSESAKSEQETALSRLMEKLDEKESLNADLDSLTLSLNQKIKAQDELKNNLQLQVQSLEAQVENYEKELISANAKIEKINCLSESAKSEQESALERLMEKLDEKERLNTDLDSLTLSLNQKIKEQEELKNNLQSQVQRLEAQVENSEKELIAANAKIDELNCSSESAKSEQETALSRLMEKLDEKERLNAGLDSMNLSLNQQIQKQKEIKNNLLSQVESLEAQVENYEKELIAANAKITELNCSSESAKSEQETALSRLMEKLDEKERLSADFDSLNLSLNQQIQEQEEIKNTLQSQVKSLETNLTAIQSKLDENIAIVQSLEAEKNNLRIELRQTMITLEEAKTNLETCQIEKKQINNLLQEANQSLIYLKAEKNDSNMQLTQATEKYYTLNSNQDDLLNKMKLLETSNSEFIVKSKEHCKELEESNKRIIELEFELEKVKTSLLNVENVLEASETEKLKLNELLKESTDSLLATTCKKEESDVLLQEMNEKLSDLSSEKDGLLIKIQELESEQNTIKENNASEITKLQEQVEKLEEEKVAHDKQTEIYHLMSSDTQQRTKSLEETVQDYEITISGLKNVIEKNLEGLTLVRNEKKMMESQLEQVQSDLLNAKNEGNEILNFLFQLLNNKKTGDDCVDGAALIVKEATLKHLENVFIENQQEAINLKQEIVELKVENEKYVNLRKSFDKLQTLIAEPNSNSSIKLELSEPDIVYDVIRQELSDKNKIKLELEAKQIAHETDRAKLEREIVELNNNNTKLAKMLEDENRFELLGKVKVEKVEKENLLTASNRPNLVGKSEEMWKKENMTLKKKLLFMENDKNKLEKKLKELREQTQKQPDNDNKTDVQYKQLLNDYIKIKQEHYDIKTSYETVLKQLDEFRERKPVVNNDELNKLSNDLQNLRDAYSNAVSTNSKYELEIVTLRKIIEDRNHEIANFQHIKDLYEKLLEENNKCITEIDTIRYKRMRDKEEYVRLLKKEREEAQLHESKIVLEVRTEYERKVEKMKDKMLKLYREEVNKECKKSKDDQGEKGILLKTIAALRADLFDAEQKIHFFQMKEKIGKEKTHEDFYSSRDSLRSHQPRERPSMASLSRESLAGGPKPLFPLGMAGSHLPMEDEEDMFNDKYLADLKEGRCAVPASRESTSSRCSELAWRNSLVPPHLKSSYPAETQFVSPTRFKDDDLKTGNIQLDDSLCKLLPGEKPRRKDFGTTSYQKPGPPTPSKNKGRLSLQGNEVHPMRDHCETKTPKRSTPNRIKALFTSRNNSNEKSQTSTPSRSRRLNIFRKPK